MSKTYSQLMKQIDSLRREADEMKRKEIEGVVDRIKEAIKVYGLTAADLGLGGARAPRAAKVYEDTRSLRAEDVADCVVFAASRPPHVNLDTIVVMPTDQATPQLVHRASR